MNDAPPIIGLPPLPAGPSFKDRRTGLIAFGILEILLGALCVLMAGFIIIGQAMLSRTSGTELNTRMILPGLLLYLVLAAAFVWLGIGSIRCRRWARALMLILAWSWLCLGVITVPLMGFLMPRLLAASPPNGQALPPGMLVAIVVFQLIFATLFMVMLPGVLVFFYRSRHVKATCEARDAVRRWTDACPLPVLGVSCALWLGGAMMLSLLLAYHSVMPFFGTLVSGWPGTVLAMGLAGLFIQVGRMWYRVEAGGWWALMALIIILGISNIITFSRVDIMEWYQKMGYPQAQIDLIRQQGFISSQLMLWGTAAWHVPLLGYLLWVKRFFPRAPKDR